MSQSHEVSDFSPTPSEDGPDLDPLSLQHLPTISEASVDSGASDSSLASSSLQELPNTGPFASGEDVAVSVVAVDAQTTHAIPSLRPPEEFDQQSSLPVADLESKNVISREAGSALSDFLEEHSRKAGEDLKTRCVRLEFVLLMVAVALMFLWSVIRAACVLVGLLRASNLAHVLLWVLFGLLVSECTLWLAFLVVGVCRGVSYYLISVAYFDFCLNFMVMEECCCEIACLHVWLKTVPKHLFHQLSMVVRFGVFVLLLLQQALVVAVTAAGISDAPVWTLAFLWVHFVFAICLNACWCVVFTRMCGIQADEGWILTKMFGDSCGDCCEELPCCDDDIECTAEWWREQICEECLDDNLDACSTCLEFLTECWGDPLPGCKMCCPCCYETIRRGLVKDSLANPGCTKYSCHLFVSSGDISLHVNKSFFEGGIQCFCDKCDSEGSRREDGGPTPRGWTRFALAEPRQMVARGIKRADGTLAWVRAYHGLSDTNHARAMIESQQLLMPGDLLKAYLKSTLDEQIQVVPGHSTDPQYRNYAFLTPSLTYCSFPGQCTLITDARAYRPKHFLIALEVLVKPNVWDPVPVSPIPELLRGDDGQFPQIDPEFENDQLEWRTKKRAVIEIVALLVRRVVDDQLLAMHGIEITEKRKTEEDPEE